MYVYINTFTFSKVLWHCSTDPCSQPPALSVPVAFQSSPTINSDHSDLWHQQSIYLHAIAEDEVHAHPLCATWCYVLMWWKITVDYQHFVRHQQLSSPALKSLRSSFFSIMMLRSVFRKSTLPHLLQFLPLHLHFISWQLNIVPTNAHCFDSYTPCIFHKLCHFTNIFTGCKAHNYYKDPEQRVSIVSLPHAWSYLWQTSISSSTDHTQTEDSAQWRTENDESLDALNTRATLRPVHCAVNRKAQALP